MIYTQLTKKTNFSIKLRLFSQNLLNFPVILLYSNQRRVKPLVTFADSEFLRFCYKKHQSVTKLPPERIPYMDLTYCINGEMHYVFEEKEYVLHSGDAILFPQGSVRQRFYTPSPALYYSFNISHSDSFSPEVRGYLPKSLRSDTISTLESVKRAFLSVSNQKNEKCTSLFWYLYYQLVETATNNEHPHIKHIKQYIAEHLTEPMTLAEISEAVHLVPHYCCSLFSKQAGQTLFDFISTQRIELAKSLLRTTDMPLTEIASACGFSDYNYFSRIFKKLTGIPAVRYKKINTLQ